MSKTPSLVVEDWPIARVKPYPRNARVISDLAVEKVAKSIQTFGFRQPIVVDPKGIIVVGHVRHRAAVKLEMETVPVHVAKGLTTQQIKAYRLMDNRSHEETTWENELLAAELSDLQAAGVELAELTGFDEEELIRLLGGGTAGLTDEDAVPEVPIAPVTVPGDVWICGNHRLRCGDSTVATDVDALLAGVKPHLMVTDPPYGVEYDPKWRLDAGVNKPWQKRAEGKVSNDDRADWREAWALFPGDVAYVWHGALHAALVAESLDSLGFSIRSQIVWVKGSLVMGRGHYHWQHEPCWYAVKQSATGHWSGDRTQSTVWQIANMHWTQGNVDDGKTIHGTQKPVECMRRPIQNNSNPGQAVYDPFLGSGTTMIAAEATGRICYGMELDPKYCDVIVKRWQDYTGREAIHEESGATFEHVKTGRWMGAEDAIKEEAVAV